MVPGTLPEIGRQHSALLLFLVFKSVSTNFKTLEL